MTLSPSTSKALAALLLSCAAATPGLRAQAGKTTPPRSTSASAKQGAKKRDAQTRSLRERRQAVALLLEAAEDARSFDDLYSRAEVLKLCAGALWPHDGAAARAVFRRAWGAATESDEAELKDEAEKGRYDDLPERFTRARTAVISAAAKRDVRLAELFFREMRAWLDARESGARREAGDGASSRFDISTWDEFEEGGQRLGVAFSLLEDGAYKSAAQVAAPNVNRGARGSLIEFLLSLRTHAPAEADTLFLRLVERARADPAAGANDVLILSSYVLSPALLVAVDEQGAVQFRQIGGVEAAPGGHTPTSISRRVRAAFFDAAAHILLRARPAPVASADGLAAGDHAALFFAVGRLLPFFERDAPQHAPALHARQAMLAGEISAARRDALSAQAGTRSLVPRNPTDSLAPTLAGLAGAEDERLRDEIRARGVETVARKKLWDRARGVANEIVDAGLRREALSVLAAYQIADLPHAFAEAEADDVERAVTFVRGADAPPVVRVLGFAYAAELAARLNDPALAAQLLNEATAQAERAAGTDERLAAYLMLATVAARFDAARAWELLPAVVRAANAADDAPDEAANDAGTANGSRQPFTAESAVEKIFEPFRTSELFATMARLDFTRALAEARSLRNDVTRVYALTALARSVLEKGEGGRAGKAR